MFKKGPKTFPSLQTQGKKTMEDRVTVATSRVATVTIGEIVVFSSFVKFKPSSVLYWVPQTS